MARERIFSFNLARKENFSVILALQLEKLPTPDVERIFNAGSHHHRKLRKKNQSF